MEQLSFEDLDKYLLDQKGKIIHQIWFGIIPNKQAAKKALEGLKKYKDSWIIKNPNWTNMCWDYKKCLTLIKTHYQEHLDLYKNYPYHIQRCDTVRCFILHRYGGFYADMDYYCNRSMDEALEKFKNDIYFVETPNKALGGVHISNSLMYSKTNHPFWKRVFIELEINKSAPYYYGRHMTIMFTTGPGVLNRVFNKYKTEYKLDYFPHKLFHPYGLTSDVLSTVNDKPEAYAIHIGKGSWETKDSKFWILLYQNYTIILFILIVMLIPSIVYYIFSKKIKNKEQV